MPKNIFRLEVFDFGVYRYSITNIYGFQSLDKSNIDDIVEINSIIINLLNNNIYQKFIFCLRKQKNREIKFLTYRVEP